jgi:O-acetyl-ADP-ribose deacetylase (regulator of RNase III)
VEKGARSLAFPSIGTGAYGFPIELACRIALHEVRNFLAGDRILERVVFVCFSERDRATYLEAASEG